MNSIKVFEFILYVSDQKRSRDFYSKILRTEPHLDVPGMTEFIFNEKLILGLMPVDGIIKILGEKISNLSQANGIPRCELYLYVDNVEKEFNNALNNGAKLINPIEERNWGDIAGYVSDFDGHIIAFAKKILYEN